MSVVEVTVTSAELANGSAIVVEVGVAPSLGQMDLIQRLVANLFGAPPASIEANMPALLSRLVTTSIQSMQESLQAGITQSIQSQLAPAHQKQSGLTRQLHVHREQSNTLEKESKIRKSVKHMEEILSMAESKIPAFTLQQLAGWDLPPESTVFSCGMPSTFTRAPSQLRLLADHPQQLQDRIAPSCLAEFNLSTKRLATGNALRIMSVHIFDLFQQRPARAAGARHYELWRTLSGQDMFDDQMVEVTSEMPTRYTMAAETATRFNRALDSSPAQNLWQLLCDFGVRRGAINCADWRPSDHAAAVLRSLPRIAVGRDEQIAQRHIFKGPMYAPTPGTSMGPLDLPLAPNRARAMPAAPPADLAILSMEQLRAAFRRARLSALGPDGPPAEARPPCPRAADNVNPAMLKLFEGSIAAPGLNASGFAFRPLDLKSRDSKAISSAASWNLRRAAESATSEAQQGLVSWCVEFGDLALPADVAAALCNSSVLFRASHAVQLHPVSDATGEKELRGLRNVSSHSDPRSELPSRCGPSGRLALGVAGRRIVDKPGTIARRFQEQFDGQTVQLRVLDTKQPLITAAGFGRDGDATVIRAASAKLAILDAVDQVLSDWIASVGAQADCFDIWSPIQVGKFGGSPGNVATERSWADNAVVELGLDKAALAAAAKARDKVKPSYAKRLDLTRGIARLQSRARRSRSASILDSLWVSWLGWVLAQLASEPTVTDAFEVLADRLISDHAAHGVKFTQRRLKPRGAQRIPRHIFESSLPEAAARRLLSARLRVAVAADAHELHKWVILEAAREVRDRAFIADPESIIPLFLFAWPLLARQTARAARRNDVDLACISQHVPKLDFDEVSPPSPALLRQLAAKMHYSESGLASILYSAWAASEAGLAVLSEVLMRAMRGLVSAPGLRKTDVKLISATINLQLVDFGAAFLGLYQEFMRTVFAQIGAPFAFLSVLDQLRLILEAVAMLKAVSTLVDLGLVLGPAADDGSCWQAPCLKVKIRWLLRPALVALLRSFAAAQYKHVGVGSTRPEITEVQPIRNTINNHERRFSEMSGTIDARIEEVEENTEDIAIRLTNLENRATEWSDAAATPLSEFQNAGGLDASPSFCAARNALFGSKRFLKSELTNKCQMQITTNGGEGIVLEPYPVQLASPFKSEREAEEQCEHYGAALCGGITCWSTRASGRACTLVLPGARRIQVERADSAESRRLLGCTNSSGLRWLTRAAMESASVQYATEHTFFAASFLAAMAHSLVRLGGGGRPGPAELRALARRSASGLAPRARRFMGRVLDAVERKLAEASAGGPGWGDDPLEADDLAIASFRFTAAGLPEYAAYPCDSSDCGYWGHSGKASPTVPALVAVLYLLLRYADRPLQELLAANAMLGGDTAARAVPLGMLAGAAQGSEALPQGLLGQLRSAPRVAERLRRL
ncbi:unnamed protein product [Prorocentrum cordatum]|uniref:Uncharacterized protein n=1 Tax=Prorocentrum cordatum TaxID=2364126 RepID=A0ABN9S8N7_9DINO|nr:unnamed protein product [Polarella glacialis]